MRIEKVLFSLLTNCNDEERADESFKGLSFSDKCFIFPPSFRIPDCKHKSTIQKINIPHPFLYLSFSSSSISRIHFISLPSSFCISPRSFLSLSLISLLLAQSAPSFLFFRPISVFSLLVPTSKSRHHFSSF
jgi:hypothetical protein